MTNYNKCNRFTHAVRLFTHFIALVALNIIQIS